MTRLLGQSLALALVVPTGLAQVAQAADPQGLGRPEVPKSPVTKVKAFDGPGAKKARAKVARERNANAAQAQQAVDERKATWPNQGTASVELKHGTDGSAKPGGLPVALEPASSSKSRSSATSAAAAGNAQVTVLDQKAARKAGVTGVLLTAAAHTPGTADLSIDYSSFASSLGGGWSQRLRLVQLPACVLTTPDKAQCRKQTPLPTDNDLESQTLSAKAHLGRSPQGGASTQLMGEAGSAASGATVLAVTAVSAGSGQSPNGAGDYSATKLSESSAWQAGGSSGSFTWAYDFTMPSAAAGPVPPLSLSYDSGSVDGRTATTNNQTTSVGEGFTLSESYITRAYGSCDDDGHDDVFDHCWKYDNATLVLNGKSTRLVKDDDSGQWHLADDDASKVTRSTGADNGDNDGEYWTVTTGDGTKYVFGLNKLDGADTQRTNSAWTVPVFGDDSGEPGYSGGSTFADRALTQAWRWNLDYVEDTHGNAVTYWYTKESNYYKKNKATKASASYTRGGYLNRIEYGLRKGALFTDKADAKVTFSYAERCTASDCSSLTKDTAENWPDVPFDAICSKDDDECNAVGPSFFTRKRLTGIDTFSYNATSSAFDPVDSWYLTGQYLDGGDIGDSSDQVLTLKSLKRTGKAGETAITVDPISFTYQMRPNRVDATDDILPLTRPRISTITSETGAITEVTLSSPECIRSQVQDAAPDTNTRSCYPQYWHINGGENASIDWFHKYRVLAVGVHDPAAGNPAVEYAYDYSGAAWHHNDDPFIPTDERTWSDWRGYREVTAYTGAAGGTRSKSVSLYMQGMHGDKNKDNTTKSVTVPPLLDTDVDFGAAYDHDRYKGVLRQQLTYNGSQPISSVFRNYSFKNTAKQTVPDAADHPALWVRNSSTYTSTYLTGSGSWRTHVAAKRYDDLGMVYEVDDFGHRSLGGDETCTRTWYARNLEAGITSLVSRTRTVAKQCSVTDASLNLPATSSTSGDVLSDTAIVYDDPLATTWLANQKPTKGEAIWTGRATGYSATAGPDEQRLPSGWQTTATTTYDTLGRPLTVTNAAGHKASTAYTPADSGPLTRTVSTDLKGYRSVTFIDPRRGQKHSSYDINLKRTDLQYDSLGRLTAVWLPNRDREAAQSPNTKFAYHLDKSRPSWVSTSTLTDSGTYNTTYALYDSLLRPLQTQSPTPVGGRLLTDTRYDTRGLAYETFADIFDSANTPDGTYTRAEYGRAPVQTETVFDGAGRPTTSTFYVGGTKKWATTTSYTGDSIATTAVQGGSAQRTITDVRGRTIETRDYAGASPADADFGTGPGAKHASTKFIYGLDGRQKTITGPDGATWSYGYDLFGRRTSTDDPDKGEATTEYNALDQVIKTTDSRGKSILSAYDELGRPTATWAGSKTDANQLTGYTYDTVLKGLAATSTRYIGGKTGAAYTQAVTAYDSMSRATHAELRLPDNDPFVKAGEPATLRFETDYDISGTVNQTSEPALGGLAAETVAYGYTGLGNLTSIGTYLTNVDYSALSEPWQMTMGTDKKVFVQNTFETGTGRLTGSYVQDNTHTYRLQDLKYTYDQAGNVISVSDSTALGGTSSAETQCFTYDGHRRLTEAWTPASQMCSDAPSADALSGPAPYWTSYTYNTAGQRTTETDHTTSTKTTYCYTNTGQPHTLTGTTTKTDCANPERTYTYDTTGNTTRRPGQTTDTAQDLSWSEEGKLTHLTEDGQSTDYLYGADGALLIRATENGERVLYAGATELHLRADGTTWAQRYYAAGGVTAAMRTNESGSHEVKFLISDHHGTASLAINRSDQTFTKRYTTPFGEDRGKPTYGPWPDDKGFLGKTHDANTGLTHIGAREYDPQLGQFISVDPLLETDKPQTLNGYSYAAQNPFTFSDPTGMGLACGRGGEECPDDGDPMPEPADHDGNGLNYGDHRGSDGPAPGNKSPGWVLEVGWSAGSGGTASSGATTKGSTSEVCSRKYGIGSCNYASPEDPDWNTTWRLAKAVLLPDFDDYRECADDVSLSSACASVLGDIPVLKFAKLGKLKKVDDAACVKCFLAGTGVLMADGTTKNIEDVDVGDMVQATDPETGETGPREVTQLIITEHDKHFNELSIATEDGIEQLTATYEHPFWSPSEDDWVEARDLTPGMTLLTDDNDTVVVTGNRAYTKNARTYNLTVDDLHTYYVLAGETPVLVHNSNCSIDVDFASQSGAKIDPSDKRGEYSMAGRALQKHAGRNGNPNGWPTPSGRQNPGAWNATGQDMLDEILTHPGAVETRGRGRIGGQWQDVVDIRLPNGLGARFTPGGSFSGFLD